MFIRGILFLNCPMNKALWLLLMTLVIASDTKAQVTGLWKVVDDEDGIEKSIVEIYEENDKYYGRVVKLLESSKRKTCENCEGALKNMPLTGMILLYDLKKTSDGGRDGKVLNPATGNIYSCSIQLESRDRLKLRGYVGVPAVGKTSYWNRLK